MDNKWKIKEVTEDDYPETDHAISLSHMYPHDEGPIMEPLQSRELRRIENEHYRFKVKLDWLVAKQKQLEKHVRSTHGLPSTSAATNSKTASRSVDSNAVWRTIPGTLISETTLQAASNHIEKDLGEIFKKVSAWAKSYIMRGNGLMSQSIHLQEWKSECEDRLSTNGIDGLMDNQHLRRYLAEAIINAHLQPHLNPYSLVEAVPNVTEEYHDVNMTNHQTHSAQCQSHHLYLGHRVTIFAKLITSPDFWTWVSDRISTDTRQLMQFLDPFIIADRANDARKDLETIVRGFIQVGERMGLMPREWNVKTAMKYERWEPNSSIQREKRFVNDPRLIENNGFAFVVRLGIAPSVIQKNFDSGAMSVQQVHRNQVLLMENMSWGTSSAVREHQP